MKNVKSVYIPSIEGNDLYSHMVRGKEIKFDYCGMIPYSLELMKLRNEGLSIQTVKETGKQISADVINVKFKQKVSDWKEIRKYINKKIDKLSDEIIKLSKDINDSKKSKKNEEKLKDKINKKTGYKDKLMSWVKINDEDKGIYPLWNEVSTDKLREYLYMNGFTVADEKGQQTKYVVYKRSSSKSRTGQCLFIKECLHKEMIAWSRMYLPFEENMKIDYAGLLAYESLVLSSLEGTIEINPKNILIVDDVESKFPKDCNVIKKDTKTELLDSFFTEDVEVSNSLFDGASLLDSKYFLNGQSMMLLRNHMFKSAAFNCDIQKFLRDHCPEGIEFNNWYVRDMFNYPMLAKDIHLIITPSSLKALKFSHVLGGEKQMWNYWQDIVDKEESLFGICKHEKKSKRGTDEEGNIMQQTSYQMINSLPMKPEDIAGLVTFEKEYIDKLKNNDDFFIQYIIENANEMNSNLMFADLFKKNKDIVNTKIFRDFRKSEINKYVTHVKKGKVRLSKGDYCVMLGNPVEFLYHAIGKFDINKPELALKDNEVYSPLFDDKKELVGFRNPHTSPSNVLIVKNTYNEDIKTYFNLTNNIVCVNAVKFAIQDILSGCDYDSDTVLLYDSEYSLLPLAKQCYGKYPVCINKVESQKKPYYLNNLDMSKIDSQLSLSQKYIGTVVNLGQLCMSRYWDLKEKGTASQKVLDSLMRKTDVMTILSGIAIDMSKKFYEIDIKKEIQHVEEDLVLKNKWVKDKKGKDKQVSAKPLFFKYVSQSDTIEDKVIKYNCPMDYLYQGMKLPYADHHENVEFASLLVKLNKRKGNRKQETKILDYVYEMDEKIKGIYGKYKGKERNKMIEHVIKYYDFYLQKLTVKTDTMYSILDKVNQNNAAVKLLNVLYTTQKEVFLEAFKQK